MSKKLLVSSLMDNLKSNIGKDGLNKRESIAQYQLSSESMDDMAIASAKESAATLISTVEDTISLVLASEEFAGIEFSKSQIAAATN
jgi:hypothetical protein